jgi:hypothetical protein
MNAWLTLSQMAASVTRKKSLAVAACHQLNAEMGEN